MFVMMVFIFTAHGSDGSIVFIIVTALSLMKFCVIVYRDNL